MSNAKVQISNQIQISNEMPKLFVPELNSGTGSADKNVILNLTVKQVQDLRFQNDILNFDIHLAFACLREVPPCGAKAGILTLEKTVWGESEPPPIR
jgi:hypothetical protein